MNDSESTLYRKPLIIDWGIGGLGTVKNLPNDVGFVYVSDSGFAPYGTVNHDQLYQRLVQITEACVARYDCDVAIIACNAASAALEGRVLPIDTMNIISVALAWLKTIDTRRLGVIGGKGTVQSKIYSRALPDKEVIEVQAQVLSAWVEQGKLDGEDVTDTIRQLAVQLGDISHLLLACTHYPALSHVFQRVLPGVELLDPASALAEQLTKRQTTSNRRIYLCSGSSEKMQQSAKQAFNHVIDKMEGTPF